MSVLLLLLSLSLAQAQEPPAPPAPISELVGIEGLAPELAQPADVDVEPLTVDIASELRCPVCQGLSVADSQAETAVAMYERIKELVRLGYSEDQIDTYFVQRYGDWVLLAPPADGLGILLWVLPALFTIGVLPLVLFLTRKRRTPEVAEAADESDPYIQKVLADLEKR